MKVELVRIDSLTLDPHNARSHEEGIPELVASLETFGQQKPIVVWHDTVIAGNGLCEAAKMIGWETIAIVRTPDEWDLPKAQAFSLADNRTAELSSWKSELDAIRFELDAQGWDTTRFGFDALTLPDFEPSEGEQPRLDQSVLHECPSCHFQWNVNSKGQVVRVE